MYNKKILFSWLLVLAWMIIIFMFSAQSGEESGNLSGSIVGMLIQLLGIIMVKITNPEVVALLIRKGAHMFIYFILAILTVNALYVSNKDMKNVKRYLLTVIICFVYAISDEFHQSFSPGRVMSFLDVIIDTVGACIGLGFFGLVGFIRKL